MLINILINIIARICRILATPKNNYFFCIPDDSTYIDKVDILNYRSDNTLSFINYILKNHTGNKITIRILTSPLENGIETIPDLSNDYVNIEYTLPIQSTNKNIIHKILNLIKYYIYFFECKNIISSNVLLKVPYKTKSQKYFALNYYTPFKFDAIREYKKSDVDFAFSTSNLSSLIVSHTAKIALSKFQNLGFPRNDNIICPFYTKETLLQLLNLPSDIKHIITYTPTHRFHNLGKIEGIWSLPEKELHDLDKYLTNQKSVLVVKKHTAQKAFHIDERNLSNIIFLQPNKKYSLYDVLAHTDLLISDYTSTYFDFLLANKPVIFFFYDKKDYEEKRGFSHDPVESICAGPIVYTYQDLANELKNYFDSAFNNNHKSKMEMVNDLFNKYQDPYSSMRTYNFIFNNI